MNPEDAKKFSLPAFPQKEPLSSDCHGMELRDYFAAKAMCGYLANPWQAKELDSLGESSVQQMATVAEISYAMADAMLKAREVQP